MDGNLQIVDVKKGFNFDAGASHEYCRQPFTLHFYGVIYLLSGVWHYEGLALPCIGLMY